MDEALILIGRSTAGRPDRARVWAICRTARRAKLSRDDAQRCVAAFVPTASLSVFSAVWKRSAQEGPPTTPLSISRKVVGSVLLARPPANPSPAVRTVTALVGVDILARRDGWATVLKSDTSIAARLGLTRQAVSSHLSRAEAAKFLVRRQRRPRGGSVWSLRRLGLGRTVWPAQARSLVDDLAQGVDSMPAALFLSVGHPAWRYGDRHAAAWLATLGDLCGIPRTELRLPREAKSVGNVLALRDGNSVRAWLDADARRSGADERAAAALAKWNAEAAARFQAVNAERAARRATFEALKPAGRTPKPGSSRVARDRWLTAVRIVTAAASDDLERRRRVEVVGKRLEAAGWSADVRTRLLDAITT